MLARMTVYLVTGATGGIGLATATALAQRPDATVLVHGRSQERTEQVAAQLGAEPLVADLSALDQVRRLAADVRSRYERIDVLVNNAALGFGPPEALFTVNHLAPFLLTNLLRAHLSGRVVTVSSAVHRRVKAVDWDHLGDYSVTKLCNVWFTREFARRFPDAGVTANAADPGFVRTGLGRGATGSFKVFLTLSRPFQTAPEKGAQTSVFLATDPGVAAVSGGYFAKSAPVEPSDLAKDDAAAARLWELSEKRVGGLAD